MVEVGPKVIVAQNVLKHILVLKILKFKGIFCTFANWGNLVVI